MGRPRLRPIRNTLAAIVVAGSMILMVAPKAAAAPWQEAWGDYDNHQQWHNANWWMQNHHDWVIVHHPEWTESYARTRGQIGDSDRLHAWHYGDGGFDRRSIAVPTNAAMNEVRTVLVASATKPDASIENALNLLVNI
jgi:hypothetical protein